MASDVILYFCIQVKEEKIGGVVRMRMNLRKGSWCLKICGLLEYAQVIKMLGNGRLEAMCFDGVKRLCHIRGKLRKKVHLLYFSG